MMRMADFSKSSVIWVSPEWRNAAHLIMDRLYGASVDGSTHTYPSKKAFDRAVGTFRQPRVGTLAQPLRSDRMADGCADPGRHGAAFKAAGLKGAEITGFAMGAWQKGWDSNPRRAHTLAGFQDRCLKPL